MTQQNKGIAAMILLAMQVAFLGVVVKYLSPYLGVYWQLITRMITAAVFMMLLFGRKISFGNIIRSSRKDLILLFVRSSAMFAGMILWVSGASVTKLFTLTVLDSLPYSAVLGFLIMGEKPTAGKLFWLVSAFFGILVITLKQFGQGFTLGIGEIMIVLSGFLMAFRSVTVRWHHQRLNDWELTLGMLLATSLMLYSTAFIRGEGKMPVNLFIPAVIGLTLAGGLLNVGTQFLTHYSYRRIEAALASIIWNVEAVFGLILGFFLFAELPSLREVAGSLIIIYSVYRMNKLYRI